MKIPVCGLLIISFIEICQTSPLYYRKSQQLEHSQSILRRKNFVEQFTYRNVKSVLKDFKCEICKLLVKVVQDLFLKGKTKEEIVDEVTRICIDMGYEDDRICIAIVREFENEVLTVIDKLVLSPDEVCGVIYGSACGNAYNPLDNWNVTLPHVPKPPVKPPKPPSSSSPKLRVLHISDIHHDSRYKTGSNADCNEPLCCRDDNGPPSPGKKGAGSWGDYRNCDTPLWTLENLFQHLQNKSDQYDYVIWTGDLPAHNVWNQTRQDQVDLIEKLTSLFKKYFPNKTIYSALGNHESAPVNSFPPPFISDNNSISWLYTALAQSWLNWLPSDTRDTILKGSYYSVSPFPGLRILSINSNYCNNKNWWLLLNTTDPADQLQWLIEQLQAAENNKERVHILGHIPPGNGACLRAWSWNYYNIINRYESTIAAQFFGHTHFDEFEVFYDNVNFKRPVSVAYIVPSITPFPQVNMGYRIYEIDGNYSSSSFSVLDHRTYIMNLTEANAAGRGIQPRWQLEYSARETLGMETLYPQDWSDLIYRMKSNSTLFNTYRSLYYKSHPEGGCDTKCKKDLLCRFKSGRSQDPLLCVDL